jgi:hypothetical protein
VIAVAPRVVTLGAYPGAGPELNAHQFYGAMPGVAIGIAALTKGGG